MSTKKQCYYEVLGVSRDADTDCIRKAYRQLALRWHPDKNIDIKVEATKKFQLITEAHEVLIDAHERQWYDSHREQILKGEDPEHDDSEGASVHLMHFFSTSCYGNKYDDSPTGFFQIYAKLFSQISADEEYQSTGNEDFYAPVFGKSNSSSECVDSFYAFWSAFTTSRDFSEYDKYNPSQAENRQERRAMEAANKKLRNSAKREYSETIRELVTFIKKRDPRIAFFQEKKVQDKKIEEEKLERQKTRKKQEKELQKIESKKQEEERWREIDKIRGELNQNVEIEHLDEKDSQDSQEHFECLACRKFFKSEKAYKSHENSKKHKETVKEISRELGISIQISPQPTPPVLSDKEAEFNNHTMNTSNDVDCPSSLAITSIAPTLSEIKEVEEMSKTERNRLKLKNRQMFMKDERDKRKKAVGMNAKKETNVSVNSERNIVCAICHESFTSRSLLFKHLNETGHATAI